MEIRKETSDVAFPEKISWEIFRKYFAEPEKYV